MRPVRYESGNLRTGKYCLRVDTEMLRILFGKKKAAEVYQRPLFTQNGCNYFLAFLSFVSAITASATLLGQGI
jgi:hypothetical protein